MEKCTKLQETTVRKYILFDDNQANIMVLSLYLKKYRNYRQNFTNSKLLTTNY